MKKAVITTGGKQYFVTEGETLQVGLVKTDGQTLAVGQKIDFSPLLVIDGETVVIGAPTLDKAKVTAEIVTADAQVDKVMSIRYKAKKRVHTVRGHRQHQTTLKISAII